MPLSFHTFSTPEVAFHLNCDPSYKQMLVDKVAALFSIPDLQEASSDYIQHVNRADNGYIRTVGGCHYAIRGCQLPFTHLQVWNKFHL